MFTYLAGALLQPDWYVHCSVVVLYGESVELVAMLLHRSKQRVPKADAAVIILSLCDISVPVLLGHCLAVVLNSVTVVCSLDAGEHHPRAVLLAQPVLAVRGHPELHQDLGPGEQEPRGHADARPQGDRDRLHQVPWPGEAYPPCSPAHSPSTTAR